LDSKVDNDDSFVSSEATKEDSKNKGVRFEEEKPTNRTSIQNNIIS
jgi:hypothetical protein